MTFGGVDHLYLVFLLVATVDSFHSLASERSSIESTYELTKYLEYQLKEIKDVYLTYLGPPFNDKDFSPPRPNATALSLPSAATRLELWRGLENQARLAQNQRAYSILLAAVRELARSTLCPSLQISLMHFCTGLEGLLGSISALMTTLGYALPDKKAGGLPRGPGGARTAPPIGSYGTGARSGRRNRGGRGEAGRRSGGLAKKSGGVKEKRRRGRRDDQEAWMSDWIPLEEAPAPRPGTRRWGRSLLSVDQEEGDMQVVGDGYSYDLRLLDAEDAIVDSFSLHFSGRRLPRSLLASTPPPSALSLLHRLGPGEELGDLSPTSPAWSFRTGSSPLAPSSSVLVSVRPAMTEFARKVEGFWLLRELQSWLWRSAKDFNRLKRRLRG
ncbi:cardiotrophin-like cytokine factor 1 [Stigmatopora nigra]